PRGGRRARRARALHPRRPQDDRPPRRAPHEPGDAGLRQGGGARLRPQDRRGLARRRPAQSRGDQGLPRERELTAMPAFLEAENLHAQYGWTKVLHGLAFAVEAGGITAILGANGAGKTTTLRAACGMVKTPGGGRLEGQRLDRKATDG